MSLQIWEPVIYIFAQGGIAGLIVGFAIRKLNKVIAATVGLLFLVVNLLWIAKMMELDLSIPPQISAIIDAATSYIPFTSQDLVDAFGPLVPALTSLPFVGGALVGLWIGFKLA